MQEAIGQTNLTNDDEQYKEFKRIKRLEEAKASVAKIECDCLSSFTDKIILKETFKTANALGIGAVVVFPSYVKACVSYLGKDPQTALIAAISYPFGEETTDVKVAAVKRAVKDGVDEVEVSAPMAFLKDGNWAYFKKECKKIKKSARMRAVRIVINCSLLNEKEILKASVTAADAGVNCLRLNFADGELISKVKTAIKGKSLIKAERAENAAAFANACVMGADTVSCTSAVELANYLLKQAENN
ncbi:MAG: hypothetical protein K2N17_05350 [Clostridia bacterium]|nr:hypothetical protein [Clostridia bacterium]